MAALTQAIARPWRYDECACGKWKRVISGSCQECLDNARANRIKDRFWAQVDKDGECWTWTGTTNGRYGMFFISKHGTGRDARDFAHRMSWRFDHGAIPDGMEVMHTCDLPTCVRPSHLTLGTHAQNMADMAAKIKAAGAECYWVTKPDSRVGHDQIPRILHSGPALPADGIQL